MVKDLEVISKHKTMERGKLPIIKSSDYFVTQTLTLKELRTVVLKWLKTQHETNPKFQKVFNQLFGHEIYFTWQGLKNDVSESSENYIEKLLSFSVLPEIVETAEYKGCVKDKRNRPDIENIHYLKSEVIVNEIEYEVYICVFEVRTTKKENIFESGLIRSFCHEFHEFSQIINLIIN